MKVVLSGGPHAGKTTLIRFLQKQGYKVVPESGLLVIKELAEKLGDGNVNAFRQSHGKGFQDLILQKQIELEKDLPENELVFLDRGLVDIYAFYRVYGNPIPEELPALIKKQRYDQVFVLDTILPYNTQRRMTNQEISLRIKKELLQSYQEFGYKPIRIPQKPVEERAQIILKHASLPLPHG